MSNPSPAKKRSPYRHLFFDLDHTLWDFESNCRLTMAEIYDTMDLKARGVDDFERFHQLYLRHNDGLWEKYRNGQIRVEEMRWKRMWLTMLDFKIADEGLCKNMGEVFLDLLPTRNILFPNTLEILRYLGDKGYALHLITNGFEKTQHAKLKNSGLDGFFQKVITSEQAGSLKPKKEIFDYALLQAAALATESIMLGDSLEVDIQGARNAGIDQVYVNHLGRPALPQPTFVVGSLKELENIF